MTQSGTPTIRFLRPALWLAALALFGFGAFWGYRQSRTTTAEAFVPLILGPPPAGLVVFGPVPKGVGIRVRGPRRLVEALIQTPPPCRVALTGVKEGSVPVPLTEAHFDLPQGVVLTAAEPALVTLKIDRQIVKQIPVTVVYKGKPAAGYTVGDAGATPASVRLTGPARTLAPLVQVPTEAADLTGATEALRKSLALDLPEGILVAGETRTVMARINIVETVISKHFTNIPVAVRNAAFPARVSPPGIDIDVKGPANRLEALKPHQGIEIYVDLAGMAPGVYVRRAVIGLPVETTLLGARPELFTVTLDGGNTKKGGAAGK